MYRLVIDSAKITAVVDDVPYELNGFPSLPFSFTYLYYEPDLENTRKVVRSGDDLVYEELTKDEQQHIVNALRDFQHVEPFIKQPELFVPPTAPEVPEIKVVHCADLTGLYVGSRELTEGYVEVSGPPPLGRYDQCMGVSYRWRSATGEWVLTGGYSEQRKEQYLQQVNYGEQLGALIKAVEALANSEPLPQEFLDIAEKIAKIKSDIPKE